MLTSRRFLPYFVTQFLGALNDNLYKNVLLLLVTFSELGALPISINLFVNLAAGVFILPFFLFSAHAGVLADNMDKAKLIRKLKLLELLIMSCAAGAILTHHYMLMLILLFLTGCQSAYFGPVKYSLLPQMLAPHELVKGNAWVEMGTFVAILLGTLWAGLLVAGEAAYLLPASIIVVLALLGYIASRNIPATESQGQIHKVKFAPFSGLKRTVKQAMHTKPIWFAILAISWFWFLGATYLTQFANFARIHLQSGPTVVSLLLALFSLGIGIGAFVCQRLSQGRVDLALVAFGALGLTCFGVDFVSAVPINISELTVVKYHASDFIVEPAHFRLMFDLFMIGVSGGLYIVPLYAYIQAQAPKGKCAQLIAANNILNAFFMVGSAIFAIIILTVFKWQITDLFTAVAMLNTAVALFIFAREAEFRTALVNYIKRYVH